MKRSKSYFFIDRLKTKKFILRYNFEKKKSSFTQYFILFIEPQIKALKLFSPKTCCAKKPFGYRVEYHGYFLTSCLGLVYWFDLKNFEQKTFNIHMYFRVLINTATFEFSAILFTISKYHKSTLCKILDDLIKNIPKRILIL